MKTQKTFFYYKLVVPVFVLMLFSVSAIAQQPNFQTDDIGMVVPPKTVPLFIEMDE